MNKGKVKWVVLTLLAILGLLLITKPLPPQRARAHRIQTVNSVSSVSITIPTTNAGSSAAPTNMLGYVQRLNTALKANTAAANLTDQQVSALMNGAIKTNLAAELWARSTMQSMRSSKGADIAVTVRVLEYLRGGRTNDAMRELEAKLEGDVASLGQFLAAIGPAMHMEIRPEYLTPLQMAKEYWLKFPRAAANPDVDSGVKHALSLVGKKE